MTDDKPPTGFPEPPGDDPGDISRDDDPHHSLNKPADEPEETEDAPHPDQDIEAYPTRPPERDRMDE
jgi:hypothetical protein